MRGRGKKSSLARANTHSHTLTHTWCLYNSMVTVSWQNGEIVKMIEEKKLIAETF